MGICKAINNTIEVNILCCVIFDRKKSQTTKSFWVLVFYRKLLISVLRMISQVLLLSQNTSNKQWWYLGSLKLRAFFQSKMGLKLFHIFKCSNFDLKALLNIIFYNNCDLSSGSLSFENLCASLLALSCGRCDKEESFTILYMSIICIHTFESVVWLW